MSESAHRGCDTEAQAVQCEELRFLAPRESTRPLRRSVVGALANQPRRVDPVRPDTPHRAGTLRFHYIGLMLVDATFAVSGFLLSLSGAGSWLPRPYTTPSSL
jgi:hypothetical protein